MRRTKLDQLRADRTKLQQDLLAAEAFMAAKNVDAGAIWQKMLAKRQTHYEETLRSLNAAVEGFEHNYSRIQALVREYSTLLGLLADPENKVGVLKGKIEKIGKVIADLEQRGQASGQF